MLGAEPWIVLSDSQNFEVVLQTLNGSNASIFPREGTRLCHDGSPQSACPEQEAATCCNKHISRNLGRLSLVRTSFEHFIAQDALPESPWIHAVPRVGDQRGAFRRARALVEAAHTKPWGGLPTALSLKEMAPSPYPFLFIVASEDAGSQPKSCLSWLRHFRRVHPGPKSTEKC